MHDISSAESVRHWLERAGHHDAPPEVQQHRLTVLAEFCRQFGRDPDELVAYCFLRKRDSGQRFCSVKRREEINRALDAFAAEQGWTGKEAVVNANIVRSYLIHNGVPIQGSVWTGS